MYLMWRPSYGLDRCLVVVVAVNGHTGGGVPHKELRERKREGERERERLNEGSKLQSE